MKLIQLTEHVYYLPFNRNSDRPIIGYIHGSNYSIRVDAGNSKAHSDLFSQARTDTNLPEESLCVITHWHWDHTFGMHAVECPTLCSTKTQARLSIVKNWKWTEEAMQARLATGEEIPFCDENIRLEYPDRTEINVVNATADFEGIMHLNLGDVHVKLITCDSPHTKDPMLILVEEDQVLFVADADCEDFYHGAIYEKERLDGFIRLLEHLDFKHYVLGHADPETKESALKRLYETRNQAI